MSAARVTASPATSAVTLLSGTDSAAATNRRIIRSAANMSGFRVTLQFDLDIDDDEQAKARSPLRACTRGYRLKAAAR